MSKIPSKIFITLFCLFFFGSFSDLIAHPHLDGDYENTRIEKITISVENLQKGESFDQKRVISKLQSKVGDPFSQTIFDRDLKFLSEEYAIVEPSIEAQKEGVYITIKIWQKSTIRSITWKGNKKLSTKTVQRELDVKPHSLFSRDKFNLALNKVKEHYIKSGYFESEIDYTVTPSQNSNEVDIEINIHEGHSGRIGRIEFYGLSQKEQSTILGLIQTKKHNFFTSWFTGTGNYHEEALEQDKLVIVNYLQNQGYADARVHIDTREGEQGRLEIHIKAERGEKYYFGKIDIEGNKLLSQKQIEKSLTIKTGSLFSPEELRATIEAIKELYGEKGYIEANVQYILHLSHSKAVYDVTFKIEEGQQFRVGMIHVVGNISTHKNVILRQSELIPGEVFDSHSLKSTKSNLESLGYFKSVNVYAVKTPEDQKLGGSYRDIVIDVEETTSGSFSLFGGINSSDGFFGGIDLSENNFDRRGLTKFWKEGLSSVRGAGEFIHLRGQIGKKQQNYALTWINPYLSDTLWKFGFDLNYLRNRLQSQDYRVNSIGGSIFANYVLTNSLTFGLRLRARNAIAHVNDQIQTEEARQERENSGLLIGLSTSLNCDTTDNSFKPHHGIRSYFEVELAEVIRHSKDPRSFPFGKLSFLNSYYFPVWRKGTFKLRGDLKFIFPFGKGNAQKITINERFFLGGDSSLRGYKPFIIGPKFLKKGGSEASDAPEGGISSLLLSAEYLQNVVKNGDLFFFFDAGSISRKRFQVSHIRMSYGFGARIELANRVPFTFGMGFPINPESKEDVRKFFFSMGAQF